MERVFGYLMPLLVCRVEVRFAIVASFRSTGCFVGEAVSSSVEYIARICLTWSRPIPYRQGVCVCSVESIEKCRRAAALRLTV